MSIFSSPSYPSRARGEMEYLGIGRSAEGTATRAASGLRALISQYSDPTNEMSVARRTANADAWQADAALRAQGSDMQRPGLSSFGRALLAGKARTRAILSGANEEGLKLFGRRAALRRVGQGMRGGQAADAAATVAGYDAMNAAKMQSQQLLNNTYAGAIGTMAGYGLGYGVDKFQTWRQGQSNQLMNTMSRSGYEQVNSAPVGI